MPIIEYFSAARFFEFDSWDYFFGKLFGETMGANLILRDEETLLTMFGKDAKVEVVQGIPGIYISERNWKKGLPVRKNRKKKGKKRNEKSRNTDVGMDSGGAADGAGIAGGGTGRRGPRLRRGL